MRLNNNNAETEAKGFEGFESEGATLTEDGVLIITGKELAQKWMKESNFLLTKSKPLQTFQFERQNFSTNDWVALTSQRSWT